MASSSNNPETPTDGSWEKTERKFSHKTASEYYDPCQDFADRSLKCMRRNGFDREMCGDYFQAYRDCKKHWKCDSLSPSNCSLCGKQPVRRDITHAEMVRRHL